MRPQVHKWTWKWCGDATSYLMPRRARSQWVMPKLVINCLVRVSITWHMNVGCAARVGWCSKPQVIFLLLSSRKKFV